MAAMLDPDRWRRIEQVLDIALEHEPGAWAAVLDRECNGQPELRSEVDALLRRAEAARRFLEGRPAAAASSLVDEIELEREDGDAHTGRRIGAYRIVRQIGRGGTARVFLAARDDGEFEQQVALKLLHAAMDRAIDHAPFGAERQILATLNHPNIARLLDAGSTDDDVPYVVLEHVDGQPIDKYCDARGLGLAERLDLFLTVCAATQHAHRNLVVHRDLKPSNILVSVDGVVKLLDFGLAKLLEPSIDREPTRATRTGQRWMTPEYAAPEQIRRAPVTTLTDVYQLGVVLYELLTARLPFIEQSLERLDDAILHRDPPAPSAVISSTNPTLAARVRGDLDAIVLKALRKEPEERFASVEAFADDLRRHLTGHPVLARGNMAGYRARRFLRRHRMEAVAALGVSVSLIAGIAFSLDAAHRARVERDHAELASRESKAVTNFVVGLFEASDPAETHGDTLTAGDLVRRAALRVESLSGEPADQARMLEVTGRLYQSLGRANDAQSVLQRALTLRQRAGGAAALQIPATLLQLSGPLVSLGRYADADSAARSALAIQERTLGDRHPDIAPTLHQLAVIETYRGDVAAAESFHRKALAVREEALGPDDTLTADSHLALGGLLGKKGRPAEAEREYRLALATYEKALGPDDPRVAEAIIHIAYVLDEVYGRYAEAEPLYRRALEIRRKTYGHRHPMVAATLSDLSDVLSRRGKNDEAIALAREHLEIMRRVYGPEHPIAATAASHTASALYHAGRLSEAETLFRRAIELELRAHGPDNVNVAGDEMNLARVMIDRRAYADAGALVRDAIRIRKLRSRPGSSGVAAAEGLLGMLMTRTGEFASADLLLRRSIRDVELEVGREQPDLRELHGWLADLEEIRGRHEAAARERAIAAAR